MPRVGRIVVTLLKMGTRMGSSYTPQGLGVFAEPFYIPKFYLQNRAFVSRGGGTRTHTVRVLSPVEYVRSRFQLFSNPLIYAQFSSTRLFSVRPCLWWVGVLVGVVAWA